MQHSLPLNFQKLRYYGLHATPTRKKLAQALTDKIKKVPNSIRTLFQILKSMLAEEAMTCENCDGVNFTMLQIQADRRSKDTWLTIPQNRGSPKKDKARNIYKDTQGRLGYPMSIPDQNSATMALNRPLRPSN